MADLQGSEGRGMLLDRKRREREISYFVLRRLSEEGIDLGISIRSLNKIIAEADLGEDEIDMILKIRKDFSGSISEITRLLKAGFNLEDILLFYSTREFIREELPLTGKFYKRNVSLERIIQFWETFVDASSSSDEEELGNQILSAYEEFNNLFPWGRKPRIEEVIEIMCNVAKKYDFFYIESTLEFLEKMTERKRVERQFLEWGLKGKEKDRAMEEVMAEEEEEEFEV